LRTEETVSCSQAGRSNFAGALSLREVGEGAGGVSTGFGFGDDFAGLGLGLETACGTGEALGVGADDPDVEGALDEAF